MLALYKWYRIDRKERTVAALNLQTKAISRSMMILMGLQAVSNLINVILYLFPTVPHILSAFWVFFDLSTQATIECVYFFFGLKMLIIEIQLDLHAKGTE